MSNDERFLKLLQLLSVTHDEKRRGIIEDELMKLVGLESK